MNIRESVVSLLSFFLFFDLLNKCNAVVGPCIYDSNPKGIIDLTSVGRMDGTPMWKDMFPTQFDDHLYSYNPCYPFSQSSTCSNVAACQAYGPDQSLTYSLGTQNSIQWLSNGDDPPAINYEADGRKLHVNMRCLTAGEPNSLEVYGYDALTQVFIMILSSKCACWDGCKSGPAPTTDPTRGPTRSPGPDPGPNPNRLSDGGIFIIILMVVIIFYVVGFMVFNKYRRQAVGLDILPHRSFWSSLPGLVFDGAKFTYQKATKKSEYNSVH